MAWTPPACLVAGLVARAWPLAAVGGVGVLAQALCALPMVVFLKINPLFCFSLPLGSAAYTAIATSSVWHHHRGRIIWKGVTFSAREVLEEVKRPAIAAIADGDRRSAPPPVDR
jgi:hypothetical protein